MENEFDRSEPLNQAKKKWYETLTTRQILLPVSVETARQRLTAAFASSFTLGHDWWWAASIWYTGQVSGNFLELDFTIEGRGSISYHVDGQLHEEAGQPCLEIKLRDSLQLWLFIPIFMVSIWVMVAARGMHKESGFLYGYTLVVSGLLPAVFFGGFTWGMMSWHRSSAMSNVTRLLEKIVTGQPLQ